VTSIEALIALTDALDCLATWDRLLEELYQWAAALGIDPHPIGQALCSLDIRARAVIRELEESTGIPHMTRDDEAAQP
jgi:hypothetical protein